MAKHIFVTGGVVSSLGKGITAVRVIKSSIGTKHVDDTYYLGDVLLFSKLKAVRAVGANALTLFIIYTGFPVDDKYGVPVEHADKHAFVVECDTGHTGPAQVIRCTVFVDDFQ